MKKLILMILVGMVANYAVAQKLNQDTLAKYSKRTEQAKVFGKVAADIHLNADQSIKFTQISSAHADKAIGIVKNTKTSRCDKLEMLRKTLKEYISQIKSVLTNEQFTMLKAERDRYHFGRRFIVMED